MLWRNLSWREALPSAEVVRPYPPFPLYLDTVSGADTNNGDKDRPLRTLSAAMAPCAGLPDWIIEVHAPEGSEIQQEMTYESTETLMIRGWDSAPWLIYGSEIIGGWQYSGDGIWSRSLSFTAINIATIVTLPQQIGDRYFSTKLIPSISTPSSPSVGELGYAPPANGAAGRIYINLPGNENPNHHVVEVGRRNSAFRLRGFAPLLLQNMVARKFLTSAVVVGQSGQPLNTGWSEIQDSWIEYTGGSGVAMAAQSERVICTRVNGVRAANDIFNVHKSPDSGEARMILNDCDGSYSGDRYSDSAQGASAHENCILEINGGRFNWNVSGGMVNVGSARCDIHGDTSYGPVVMDHNMRLGVASGTIAAQASCAWMDNAAGVVTGDVTVSNGQGIGVKVNSPGRVVGAHLIKSIRNAWPDIGI